MRQIVIDKSTDVAALTGRTFSTPIGLETYIEKAWHSPSGGWLSMMVEVRNTGRPGRGTERTAYAMPYGASVVEI